MFLKDLRAVEAFLGDNQWRRKLRQECMAGQACFSKFKYWNVVHIDWKWEFLSIP